MRPRLTFTVCHGFAVSLALHSALGLAVVLPRIAPAPAPASAVLVIQLQGVIAEIQSEQKVLGEAALVQASVNVTPDRPPPEAVTTTEAPVAAPVVKPLDVPPSPVTETTPTSSRSSAVGVDEQLPEQTITAIEQPDPDRIKDYVMALSKLIQGRIVYPDQARRAGMRGVAAVSFSITTNGQIRQETLKIVKSSGQPILDASALQTIRASAPFDAPPREVTVTIEIDFGRRP